MTLESQLNILIGQKLHAEARRRDYVYVVRIGYAGSKDYTH